MDFLKYTKQNSLNISRKEINLCIKGISYLQNTKDKHHDETHIYRMLRNYSQLKHLEEALGNNPPNDPIVLISICWHDAWKATRAFSPNMFIFTYNTFYEGIGAKNLFLKEAENFKIKQNQKKHVSRIIKGHVRLDLPFPSKIRNVLFKTSIESMILRDLDALDSYSTEFLHNFIKVYKPRLKKWPHFKKIWEIIYKNGLKRMNEDMFYFDWTKKRFQKYKTNFINRVEKIIN